jgi:hypothetical protein
MPDASFDLSSCLLDDALLLPCGAPRWCAFATEADRYEMGVVRAPQHGDAGSGVHALRFEAYEAPVKPQPLHATHPAETSSEASVTGMVLCASTGHVEDIRSAGSMLQPALPPGDECPPCFFL